MTDNDNTTTGSTTLTHTHTRSNILSVEECQALYSKVKGDSKVVFVDGSWHMPNSHRDARLEYETGPRLPGAVFFDVDDIASTGCDLNPKNLPHMMPPAKLFGLAMDKLGIGENDTVVVYAAKGCFAAPRTWFTFRSMGHDVNKVYIMNGGIDDWIETGGLVDTDPAASIRASDLDMNQEAIYSCAKEASQVVDIEYVSKVVDSILNDNPTNDIVYDARSLGRFSGTEPEPRKGIRGGHMPGSKSLFFLQFHDVNNPLKFQSRERMNEILLNSGIDHDTLNKYNIISSCGTGVTACSLVLAMAESGHDMNRVFVYDGSWTEWGDPTSDKPVVK